MIPLNIFNDFCSWWTLWWILPFVLGALLGWAIYGKWKQLHEEEQMRSADLSRQVTKLESEVKSLKKNKGSDSSHSDLEDKLVDYERRERYYKSELKAKNAELEKLKTKAEPVSGESQKDNNELTEQPSNTTKESRISTISTPNPNRPNEDYGVVETSQVSAKESEGQDGFENNMQVIEGIGPRMESVLYENGIHNWAQLSNYTAMELKDILNKYGSKYAMINAKHWPMQASLAASGNWEELIAYQKSIYTNISTTKSKAETFLISKGLLSDDESTNTDLQAFVGIDKKVEKVLKKNGINSWEDLATTPIVKIRGILEEEDQKYKKVNPTSWPKQAQLALAGKTQMLQEYQDFLKENT